MSKDKKEKRIVFSEEIDSKVNGFTLAITFVLVGTFLLFENDYFGNQLASSIIRWVFIVIGGIGLSVEISKSKKIGIKGLDNFAIGSIFIGIWIALYLFAKHWIVNIVAFLMLFLGVYFILRAIIEIFYSISIIARSSKEKKESKSADILTFITAIIGLLLVVMQVLQQANMLSF